MKLIFLESFLHSNITYEKAKATVMSLEQKLIKWVDEFDEENDKVKALCRELTSEDSNLDSSTIESHLKTIEFSLSVVRSEMNYKNVELTGFRDQYAEFSSAVMANRNRFRESEQEIAEKLEYLEDSISHMSSQLAIMGAVFENLRLRVKFDIERKCLQDLAPHLVADELPPLSRMGNGSVHNDD